MRWLITGSGGQLGRSLVDALEARQGETVAAAFDHSHCDIAEPGSLARLLEAGSAGEPDILVNAAAYTAVDRCESETELAWRVNAEAPGWLAEDCRAAGLDYVHVSTDYVFSGAADEPYPETAPVEPRTAYGRSKAEGEVRVLKTLPGALIVRTSWVFGPGKNFVGAILRQAQRRAQGLESGPLRVVSDQQGSPTYSADLAEAILDLAGLAFGAGSADGGGRPSASGAAGESEENRGDMSGVFHLAGGGVATWFEFARAILDLSGHGDLDLEPLATPDLDLPAERPLWSVLGCERARALGIGLRPWREALAAYLVSDAGMALQEGAI